MATVRYKVNGQDVSAEEFSAGSESRLKEMFEAGKPPMSNTDREFMEGHCNGSQFEAKPEIGDFLAKDLIAAGGSPKGKTYLSGLANYPGDPRAWVSDKSDVKRVCEERNFTCTGAVEHKPDSRLDVPGG